MTNVYLVAVSFIDLASLDLVTVSLDTMNPADVSLVCLAAMDSDYLGL